MRKHFTRRHYPHSSILIAKLQVKRLRNLHSCVPEEKAITHKNAAAFGPANIVIVVGSTQKTKK